MSSKYTIDINADLGEGIGNDSMLIPLLSSCNIACGGHAGDVKTMASVVKLAKTHKVKIGAHPSFPDKKNFGRSILEISQEDLYDSLKAQIDDLLIITKRRNVSLHHIKPHGALYNLAFKDIRTANTIIDVVKSYSKPYKLYAPYGSVLANQAKLKGVDVVYEGFADRNYNADLSLVSRQHKEALLNDNSAVFKHVRSMIYNQNVKTLDGTKVAIVINTLCVHGDTKNALDILKYLHTQFKKNKIEIV